MTTAGINMGTLSGSLGVQAIVVDSTRTRTLTIGNSSATSGTLTLLGGTVSGSSNVILRNASGSLFTLQDNETGTGKTMRVALGNATDNVILLDGAGGITISSVIQGAGRNLTLTGTAAASATNVLTLSAANTYSGTTTIARGAILVQNSSALGTSTVVVNAGAQLRLDGGVTISRPITIAGAGFSNTSGAIFSNATSGATATYSGNVTLAADGTRIGAQGQSGGSTLVVSGTIDSGSNPYGLVIRNAGGDLGYVQLSASNTYLGNTWIAIGTLRLAGGDNRLPTTTNLRLGYTASGTFDAVIELNGRNQEVAGLALDAATTVPGNNNIVSNTNPTLSTFTVNTGATSSTYNGVLTGNLKLVKAGTNSLTFTGTGADYGAGSNFTGGVDINAGTLVAAHANVLGTGPLTINSGTLQMRSSVTTGLLTGSSGALITAGTTGNLTLTLNSASSGTYAGSITNGSATSVGLAKQGAGTLTLTGESTFTGGANLTDGILAFSSIADSGSASALGASGVLRINGGLFNYVGTGHSSNRLITFGVGSGTANQTLTLRANGSGALNLTNSGSTPWGAGGTRTMVLGGTSTELNTYAPLIGDNTFNAINYAAAITKSDAGTWLITGSNSFTGGTTIGGGTLIVGNTKALGATTGALAVNGGTLDLNGRSVTVGLLTGSSGATITSNTTGSVTLTASSASSGTYGGVIADGSGGGIVALTKSGAGTLVLAGSNSYTGGTTIDGGVLQTGTGTAAGSLAATGTVTVKSGGEWRLFRSDAGVAVASPVAGSGTVTFQGIGMSGSSSYSLNADNSAFTGRFVVQSGARLNTNANVNATGNAALIDVQSGGQLLANRDVAAPLNISGVGWQESSGQFGAIRLASNAVLSGSIVLQGNSRVTAFSASSGTLAGVISGAFALDLQHGTIGLGGSNTFSGGANLGVANGATTIALGNVAAFGTGTVALVASTTTTIRADVSGTVANAFSLGSGVVGGFNTQSNTLALAGVVGGDGGLTKSGPGVLRLLGSNTYAGATVIASGTLEVAGNGTLGGGAYAGTISNTGAFRFSSSANQTLSGPINGSGSLTMAGSGTLTLTGSSGYTGATAVEAGVLRIGAGGVTGSLASSAISVASGALLAFNRTDAYGGAFSSLISGSGGVRVDTGLLTLAGLNTYTGPTDVLAGGTLGINGGLANSVLTVASGATLMGSGTIAGLTTIAGFHRPGNSPGIETFTNGLTYASSGTLVWELWANTMLDRGANYDGVDVTGGALTIDPSATLQLDFGTLAQGSTVDWSNSFWATNRQWTIIDVSGGATWNGSPFFNLVIGNDALGQSLTSVRGDATFTVTQSGGDLVLVYAAVPEPGALALAGIGLVSAAWVARRRRARRHAAA